MKFLIAGLIAIMIIADLLLAIMSDTIYAQLAGFWAIYMGTVLNDN